MFPVLYRNEKTGRLSISRGDGMVIRKGHWTEDDSGSVRVVSSIIYTPLPQIGKRYPSDEREEEWKASGAAEGRIAAKLKTSKVTLVPLQNFNDLDFLSKYISVESGSGS